MAPRQWSRDDDKLFERALVLVPENSPDRFENIAHLLHISLEDVMLHYKALVHDIEFIESGQVHLPDYSCGISSQTKHMEKSKKRANPWSDEEHRDFLIGLGKFGRGDWKSISRMHVKTRTPTQVASHAQKYYLRQALKGKAKKRSSIHDIVLVDHAVDNATVPRSDLDSMMGQPHFGQQMPGENSHSGLFLGLPR